MLKRIMRLTNYSNGFGRNILRVGATAFVLGGLTVYAAWAADGTARKVPHRRAVASAPDVVGHNAGRFRFVCDRNGNRCTWVDRTGAPTGGYSPHGWFGYDPTRSSGGHAFPCGDPEYYCSYQPEIGTQRQPKPLIR
jgi:hypothetical protein